ARFDADACARLRPDRRGRRAVRPLRELRFGAAATIPARKPRSGAAAVISPRVAAPPVELEPQLADHASQQFIRRGWLVRRTLLAADLVGLTAAFLFAELVFSRNDVGRIAFSWELLLFLPALPVWVVIAKLYRLYEHDEERPDHSTVDDLVGLFHMV